MTRSSRIFSLAFMSLLAFASASWSGDWSSYVNDRYAYSIAVPPGFSAIVEAANDDGGVAQSADGNASLAVWGGYMMADSFADEIAPRVLNDKNDGWHITYDRRTTDWASWSGSRAERIFYQRSMLGCDGAAIHIRIEYDRDRIKAFDPIISRLVQSLRPEC